MNRLTRLVLAGFALLGMIDARGASSQQSTAQVRTQAIVATFNKRKHVVKEKHGLRVEKYKEIRSEPAIKQNVRDYAGAYEEQGLGWSLDLVVDAKGNVTGTGYEPVDADGSIKRRFTLRNGRIGGALLTATKVYASGATEPFEGVFINKTSFDSPTDRGVTTFGLGVVGHIVTLAGGVTIDRVFYQRR